MDREYIIAGFRIRLEQADRLFVRPGSHMARAFEPFAAEADPAAPLTMRLIPDCTINKINRRRAEQGTRRISVRRCGSRLPLRAYAARLPVPHGSPQRGSSDAILQSVRFAGCTERPARRRTRTPSIPDAFRALDHVRHRHLPRSHCDTLLDHRMRRPGRPVSGRIRHGKSTHTRLWQEHIPGARLLNDDSPIIRCTRGRRPLSDRPGAARPLLPQHFAADCRNRPVEPGPGQRNHPTVNLAGRRIAAPVLPPAFAYDNDLQDRICRTLSDILTQAPVWHLACLPDKAAAELSYATVLEGKQRA